MRSSDKKIKAILFDLGDTLLNFGDVDIGRVFKEGAKSTYNFLQEAGQPVGSLKKYAFRNFLAIRWRSFISNVTGNDFDSLELLKKIGKKQGYNLDESQWQKLADLYVILPFFIIKIDILQSPPRPYDCCACVIFH